MIFYANRRKSDGFFLPSGRKTGFTHDSPLPFYKKSPRLFVNEAAAKRALKCWLQGEWVSQSSIMNEDGEFEYWSEPPSERPLDRIEEDWETVVVNCEVVV